MSSGPSAIPAETAWQRLEPHLEPLPAALLPRHAAAGRVLAAPLHATVDAPFADVSAMDGYALGGEPAPGTVLPVAGTIPAGEPPGRGLPPGAALRIMTGAPLPAGADRVVPVEDTDGGLERVAIFTPPAKAAHIRVRGEIVRRGDPLLEPGAVLSPAALALLAAHGHQLVPAHPAPRVRLLVTGDEVVPADTVPGPGQLRDSHSDFLGAAAAAAGAELLPLGIAPDRPEVLRQRLAAGLDADVLLVSGGVSRGAFDFVEEALGGLGFRPLFEAVSIQPGKPLVAMVPAGGAGPLVFGLPGNPASVMVCFWLLVRPALRRLQGHRDGFWSGAVRAVATAPLPGARQRDRLLPARLEWHDGSAQVTPLAPRGSHDLAAFARAEALVRVASGSDPAPAGSICTALTLSLR